MSPIISTISSSYRNYIKTIASIGGGVTTYSPVIPTNNLYSHWDFSKLTDPINTSYTSNLTAIPSSSGLSIGASITTPTMYHRTVGATHATAITTQNSLKCLSLGGFSGAVNNGSFFQSDGNAFPDITSSSFSYTWIAVWKHSASITNWTRLYRWYINGYSYDFNHGVWFINSTNTELNAINYSAGQRRAEVIADSNRASSNIVHYDIVTLTGSNYIVSSSTVSNGVFTSTGSLTQMPTYSVSSTSNRYFQIRPVDYTGNNVYPPMVACEYAFYDRAMTQFEQTSTIQALRNKWG